MDMFLKLISYFEDINGFYAFAENITKQIGQSSWVNSTMKPRISQLIQGKQCYMVTYIKSKNGLFTDSKGKWIVIANSIIYVYNNIDNCYFSHYHLNQGRISYKSAYNITNQDFFFGINTYFYP